MDLCCYLDSGGKFTIFFCWYGRLVFRYILLILDARSPLEDDSAPSYPPILII